MNIMKYRKLFFAISLFFLIPGITSLFIFGLNPSIDFVGGSKLEFRVLDSNEDLSEKIKETLVAIYRVDSVSYEEPNDYVVLGESIDNQLKNDSLTTVEQSYGQVEELKFETVGATLSKELLRKTFTALILVAVIITLYVARQFDELKYGVSAILAMFHDSLILLGSFSILGIFGVQVDVLFVTALLTTLSFSVHDTIVVYDRIRELKRTKRGLSYEEVVNLAVIETLSRSINNSITIIIMLLALVLLGGSTIKWFAVALLIGAVTGTYSSTFTAAPLLLLWDEIGNRRKLKRKKK